MTEFHPDVLKALNEQANREIYAEHVYLHASFYFDQRNYDGIAEYLKKEAANEHGHALKFYDYIHLRQGGVGLVREIPQAVSSWDSPQDVFAAVLQLEQDYTKHIHELRNLAISHKDHGTEIFLQDFVREQEESVREWLRWNDKIQSYAALPGLLWHLNKEMD
jgi:ferritin